MLSSESPRVRQENHSALGREGSESAVGTGELVGRAGIGPFLAGIVSRFRSPTLASNCVSESSEDLVQGQRFALRRASQSGGR
jgi:hypothetical protein